MDKKLIEQKKLENYKLGLLYEMLVSGKGNIKTLVSGVKGLPRYDKQEMLSYIKEHGSQELRDELARTDEVAGKMFNPNEGRSSLEIFRKEINGQDEATT